MASWSDLANQAPELAAFGEQRLRQPVSYLATVRPDGSPRVHPVTPILGDGRLFVFMEPTSSKGRDLRRDPRYALHTLVTDQAGSAGEFSVRGTAVPVTDEAVRRMAAGAASYSPNDSYVLFELGIDGALSTVYEGGRPARRRWGEP